MYAVEYTASAEADLDSIVDYLAFHLCNPPAAQALLDSIDDAIDCFTETPDIFPLCNDDRLAELGYHKAAVRSYIMVYEIDDENYVVRVLRFFHESENYLNKL